MRHDTIDLAIEFLQAHKRGEEVTLEDIFARCRERVVDPDPVILLVLRQVRDEDTYHELPLDRRTAVVLDTPEMVDAMCLYNETTGG